MEILLDSLTNIRSAFNTEAQDVQKVRAIYRGVIVIQGEEVIGGETITETVDMLNGHFDFETEEIDGLKQEEIINMIYDKLTEAFPPRKTEEEEEAK